MRLVILRLKIKFTSLKVSSGSLLSSIHSSTDMPAVRFFELSVSTLLQGLLVLSSDALDLVGALHSRLLLV